MSTAATVWGVIHGYTGYWAAVAAVEAGLFDALADGPADARALGARCGATEDGVAVLADALVAGGLLLRDGGAYVLSDAASAHLVHGRPASMADLLLWSPGPWGNWRSLPARLRGAAPPDAIGVAFYSHLVDATLPSQLAVARAVLPALGLPPGARLLELGAGRAPWASALIERDPAAAAVTNDLDEVGAASLGPQATFVAGDYLTAQVPSGPYDLVVLGHVLRAEPDARAERLVSLAASLGARVVVTEYLGGRDPVAFPQPALLALTMLAATTEGRLCTQAQVEGWLRQAGCERVTVPEAVAGTDVLIGATRA